MFRGILNFAIPPKGYITILSTFIPSVLAVRKCPSSWTIIRKLIMIKVEKEAVKIEIKANIYTKKCISKYLDIVFIV